MDFVLIVLRRADATGIRRLTAADARSSGLNAEGVRWAPYRQAGTRVRVDYSLGGEYGREWLRDLVGDLDEDGLAEIKERDGETVPRLQR